MNTKISYLYRDADNYKVHNECVVNGVITNEMKDVILSCLEDGEHFIPSQVGLPEVRFDGEWTEADHCWFELTEDGFEETNEEPTVNLTSENLVEAFRASAKRWDDFIAYAPAEKKEEKVFENLTPGEFREFLRELQKDPYQWPNLYFAWEKPDASLFIVGIKSSQMYEVIVHEINPNSWLNTTHASEGVSLEYSSVLCGINPKTHYIENNQRFDPAERLVSKVAEYSYLGAWEDPDVLMDSTYGYSRTLACGRWELAVEHICPDKLSALNRQGEVTVDELINNAKGREIAVVDKPREEKTFD